MLKILFIGDIVGSGGRQAVKSLVPALRNELQIDFCIANGENMAGGNGFTKRVLDEIPSDCVEIFTAGDHTWDQKEFPEQIKSLENVLRPENFGKQQPGCGYRIYTTPSGVKIGVLNLIGRVFIAAASDNPFLAAQAAVEEMRKETPVIFVDFHAEATSEKIAMGRMLDGKVSAVIGTHTHVPTADCTIFPGGTAYQSDAGMVGSRHSILGREINSVVGKFITGMPARFPVNDHDIILNCTVITIDESTGKALEIMPIQREYTP